MYNIAAPQGIIFVIAYYIYDTMYHVLCIINHHHNNSLQMYIVYLLTIRFIAA